MKAIEARDLIKRNQRKQSEEKKRCLQALKHCPKLRGGIWSVFKLSSFKYKNYTSRCIFTGRSRGVNQSFKLSRHEFKRWNRIHFFPGVRKSSW